MVELEDAAAAARAGVAAGADSKGGRVAEEMAVAAGTVSLVLAMLCRGDEIPQGGLPQETSPLAAPHRR